MLTHSATPRRFLESTHSQYWSAGQVREYFGGVSAMWIYRRLADPASGFPKPVKLGSARNYWRIEEVQAWARAHGGGAL
jgi:predicted DNA-binding transcriptional regulator AlpA